MVPPHASSWEVSVVSWTHQQTFKHLVRHDWAQEAMMRTNGVGSSSAATSCRKSKTSVPVGASPWDTDRSACMACRAPGGACQQAAGAQGAEGL